MKKRFTTALMSLLMIMGIALVFSSCDDGWGPDPYPNNGGTFIDRDLTGSWKLYDINGVRIVGYDVNYMQFNGNGNGRYYYYTNGRLYSEGISYWCKGYGSGDFQLNIQYSNGTSHAMSYWFQTTDDLYLSWRTANGVYTYHYIYTAYIP